MLHVESVMVWVVTADDDRSVLKIDKRQKVHSETFKCSEKFVVTHIFFDVVRAVKLWSIMIDDRWLMIDSIDHSAAASIQRWLLLATITNVHRIKNKRSIRHMLQYSSRAAKRDVSLTRRKVDSCFSIDGTV